MLAGLMGLSCPPPGSAEGGCGPFPWEEAAQQLTGQGVPAREGNLSLLSVPPAEQNPISPSLEQPGLRTGRRGALALRCLHGKRFLLHVNLICR